MSFKFVATEASFAGSANMVAAAVVCNPPAREVKLPPIILFAKNGTPHMARAMIMFKTMVWKISPTPYICANPNVARILKRITQKISHVATSNILLNSPFVIPEVPRNILQIIKSGPTI